MNAKFEGFFFHSAATTSTTKYLFRIQNVHSVSQLGFAKYQEIFDIISFSLVLHSIFNK